MEVEEGEQEAQGGLDLALAYGGTAPFQAVCVVQCLPLQIQDRICCHAIC